MCLFHYGDVIMSTMASQITSVSIIYSTVCSGPDQRKHQSSASLALVRGIHRRPVNSPHTGPVTPKMFHLMTSLYIIKLLGSEFVVMKMGLRLTHFFREAFRISKIFLPHKLRCNETPCIKIHSYLYGACSEFACTNRYLEKFITNSDVIGPQNSYKI